MRALLMLPTGDTLNVEVDNTLEAFQYEVGGHIDGQSMGPTAALIFNKEAEANQAPINHRASALGGGHTLRGPVLLVGVDGEECIDAPLDLMLCAHAMLPTRRVIE